MNSKIESGDIAYWASRAASADMEIERLRGLLRECIPELMGDVYDYADRRICKECGDYQGHVEGCLVKRIDEALR